LLRKFHLLGIAYSPFLRDEADASSLLLSASGRPPLVSPEPRIVGP
jgi:hypothetical protein